MILANLYKLPAAEQAETLAMMEELDARGKQQAAKISLLSFATFVAPVLQIETEPKVFMVGPHHRKLAALMDAVARGEKKRVLISVAPRFGKSLMSSYLFPAWYLGQFPNRRVIMASHTGDMAVGFGRKVRDLIMTPEYRAVFPEVELKQDSKAAGQWSTNKGGEYYAVGVGGALAGRGANLVVIDDPFSEQVVMAGNTDVFDDAWSWFQTGPLQRLAPDGACIIIHCMTGDTGVLLPNGTEKNLRDIKVGEIIATYTNGQVGRAKVLNWKNQGPDKVLAIRMRSGIIVRANERHPFLVQHGDRTAWTKVQNLKVGEHILRVIGESTKMYSAPWTDVAGKLNPEACVPHTITGPDGQLANVRHRLTQYHEKITTSSIGTVLDSLSTKLCLLSKTVCALYAAYRPGVMYVNTGATNFASTTVTIPVKYEVSCATTATSPLGMAKQKPYSSAPLSTYEIIPDEIISITEDGVEDVFDIQVEGTENFIANGLISHNTRWNKGDLIGRLQAQMAQNSDADQWDIIEFPAILSADTPQEKSLWPERWPLEALKQKRANMAPMFWQAQYMQALALDTPIPTPRGWTTMAQIQVGDEVLGINGAPIRVVGKSEVFSQRPAYEIRSDDGATVIADEDHLWTVKLGRNDGEFRTYSTKKLYAREHKRAGKGLDPRRPRPPEVIAWQLPEQKLPIDPYVLGAWLGDGTTGQATQTAHEDDQAWWFAEFERLGYPCRAHTDPQSFGVLGGLRTALISSELLQCKRIPPEYLRGSAYQRLSLLQGLMDTDGTVQRGQACFANTREDLADAVCELVLSLGGKPFKSGFYGRRRNGEPAQFCYRIHFYLANACRMPRKAAKARARKEKIGRFLSFSYVGLRDTQCIRVNAPDGLFLAGTGCLPTHNSPTSEAGALVKREWWQDWEKEDPPHCEYLICSLDAAQEAHNRADFNAFQVWGVFYDEREKANIILLDAWKKRMEYPELKSEMIKEIERWEPDTFLIEKKSSGSVLYQEFRNAGVPVSEFTPGKGQDKIARVNSVSDIFSSGLVWAPRARRWAMEVIEECSDFPNGDFDDQVDAMTLALRRFRTGGFIRLPTDEKDEDKQWKRKRQYY